MGKQRKAPPLLTDHELRGLVAASTLDRYQRSTLLAMADGLYRHDLRIKMGIQRLANSLGLQRRATINRIHSLEQTCVILKERGGGGRYENGKGRINIWRLDLDTLRNQALAKAENLESNPENNTSKSTNKGAVERRQLCSPLHRIKYPQYPKKRKPTASPAHATQRAAGRCQDTTRTTSARGQTDLTHQSKPEPIG